MGHLHRLTKANQKLPDSHLLSLAISGLYIDANEQRYSNMC
jgi:hypothetical protein